MMDKDYITEGAVSMMTIQQQAYELPDVSLKVTMNIGRLRMKKKIISCLLVMFLACVSGCGKTQAQDLESSMDVNQVTFDDYIVTVQDLDENLQMARIAEDRLFLLTFPQGKFRFCNVSMDGNDIKEIPLSLSENERITCFYVNENSIFFMQKQKEESELVKIDRNGKILEKVQLEESLSLREEPLNCMTVDGAGNVVLATSSMVYLLNKNLQLVNKIELEKKQSIITFCRTRSGKIICGIQEENAGIGREKLRILDTETKEWGKNLPNADAESFIDEKCLLEGTGYDVYYKDGVGVFGYDENSEKWTKVMDALYSLVSVDEMKQIFGEYNGEFFGVAKDLTDEGTLGVSHYIKSKPEETDKKIITLAGYNITNKMRSYAKEFNRTHTDCKVKVVLYDDEEHTKMAMDIMSGKVPDVFMTSTLGISIQQMVARGILADLTTYYENDTTIHTKDIVPSVLEAMKVNDRLYSVCAGVMVSSAVCRTSDINRKNGWTFEEMEKALAQKGDDAIAFDEEDKSELLISLLANNMDSFVDWQTGECRFDSQEFKNILELCNKGVLLDDLTEREMEELWENTKKKKGEGKVLLGIIQNIDLEDIQKARQEFGSDITCIGLPERDREGSYFTFGEEYGIYSGSEVKDEAWEFVKVVMSKEFQMDENHLQYPEYPTRKDALAWKMETKIAKEAYEDSYGNWIDPIKNVDLQSDSDSACEETASTNEDVELIMDLISKTHKRSILDDAEVEIIIDETAAYFNGDKSLEKVTNNIQKRMVTYVNEQR